jgi:hypothetical protein
MSVLLWVQYVTYKFSIQLGFYRFLIVLTLYYTIEYVLKRFGISEYAAHLVYYIPSAIIIASNPTVLQVYWKRLLLLAAVYRVILPIIIFYGLKMDSHYLSNPVHIQHLKPGMIPGEQIIRRQIDNTIGYSKKPATISGLYDKDILISPDPQGLSEEQIHELKRLSKMGYFEEFNDVLMIQYPMYFALMILSGIIMTIICGGPFYVIFYR